MRSRTGTVRAPSACSVATTSAGALAGRAVQAGHAALGDPGRRRRHAYRGRRCCGGSGRPPPAGHRVPALADAAAGMGGGAPGGVGTARAPYEGRCSRRRSRSCGRRGPAQGEPVVLHQDLHGGNVLRAQREPWLAIDPKPLVGEREFDTASFLRDRRWELPERPRPAGSGCDAGSTCSPPSSTSTGSACAAGASRTRSPGACPASPSRTDMAACARWLAAA